MTICAVTDCPALAAPKKDTCGVHADARTAKALNIHKLESGKGGQRCVSCRRTFKATDWVLRQMKVRAVRKAQPGNLYGYAHVACEPASPRISKRAIRESVKPLLEACADEQH